MQAKFEIVNDTTKDGTPAGGHIRGEGIAIKWRSGPEDKSTDVTTIEFVVRAIIQRMEFYQASKNDAFATIKNSNALAKLNEALNILIS